MDTAPSAFRFPLREAIERLQWLGSLESFSPLTGASALVIDLDAPEVRPEGDGADARPAALERAAARLAELPCVTIGVTQRAVGSSASAIGAASGASAALRTFATSVASAVSTVPEAGETDAVASFARRLDLIVDSDAHLQAVLAQIARQPIAATALAQLLRLSEELGTNDALAAESFVYSTLQAGPGFAKWLATKQPRDGAVSRPSSAGIEPSVSVVRDGPRLHLELNRPQRHNAYSSDMRDALVAALEVAAADSSIEGIVLSGRGPSFCAGGDLAEFGTLPDPATAHAIRSTRSAARLLARLAPRVRAEVHGACIGAGVELAAFAARVVARDDAFFQLPEVAMGLVPGAGGTASIPRRIGRQRTAYMALSGARVDARTALRWGLVDAIAG